MTEELKCLFAFEQALKQLAPELIGKLKLNWEKTNDNTVVVNCNSCTLSVKSKSISHCMLGVTLAIISDVDKHFNFKIVPKFENCGVMLDCSHNAVLNIKTVKKFIRFAAMLGLSYVMLYLEDTYAVKGYPDFGNKRGKYSCEELKELDDYAFKMGIELIPCIQTLAHLDTFLSKNSAKHLRDTKEILLVDDKKVLFFIEACIKTMRTAFRSNKIHVGLDEANGLGDGAFRAKNRQRDKKEIFLKHVYDVCNICEKYGLAPMIWADMLCENNSPTGASCGVPTKDNVVLPDNLNIVYWNYLDTENEAYSNALVQQKNKFHNVSFACGAWTWKGLVPNFSLAKNTIKAGLNACFEQKIANVMCTMWRGKSAETTIMPGIINLIEFASNCFEFNKVNVDTSLLFELITKKSAKAYRMLENFDYPSSSLFANPSKYFLYQDCLLGLFDKHCNTKTAEKYSDLAQQLDEYCNDDIIIQLFKQLALILKTKATFGNRLRKAFDENRSLHLFVKEINEILDNLTCYNDLLLKIWLEENKIFGFEVVNAKLGALKARITFAKNRIESYEYGESGLEELNEMQLPFSEEDTEDIYCNDWKTIITPARM